MWLDRLVWEECVRFRAPTQLNMEFCLNNKSRQLSGWPLCHLTLTSLTEELCLDSKSHQLSGWPFYHPNLTYRTEEFRLNSKSRQLSGWPLYHLTLTSLTEELCLNSKSRQLSGWPFSHPNPVKALPFQLSNDTVFNYQYELARSTLLTQCSKSFRKSQTLSESARLSQNLVSQSLGNEQAVMMM